ncbi:uncharacterized protein B0I36DRAFT_243483 [Microdochium trichocladiopsis]|uniref:Zn(2)-C6 fungal-type domain-containing protein n=1 Tax=Microdochium trichocladiopsis TaxID=1682393 RepID=A0A9P8Y3W1_9PEZI|nr:uncharacterized protein B0I36DRAFT_243483 [Microdochium trichocladiopsis]KAH7030682.1 hypothetical protein B0I36DRAFT_243483 [Microdochium trichocladiopsis]
MVYTGKPSKSCEACRLRKRRCDKGVPGCGQCRRQGTECPGYRDPLSLAFRNQTAHGTSPASSDGGSDKSSNNSVVVPFFSRAPSLHFQMDLDLADLGLTYFQENYATGHMESYETFMTVAPKVLATDRDPTAMTSAIHAISLAGIANSAGAQVDQAGLSRRAWSKYCTALRAVNQLLTDPVLACKDSTLFAILLLSIFEAVTCSGPASVSAWKRHIDGASALIAQRGLAQFERDIGRLAFRETLVHILTSCYRLQVPVPPQILAMRREFERRLGPQDTIWLMSHAHMDALDLWQRAVAQEWPLPAALWESLLLEGIELDRQNVAIFDQYLDFCGLERGFRTMFNPRADPALVYEGAYHVYPNMRLARLWTGTRTSRILVNRLIRALAIETEPGASFGAIGMSQAQLIKTLDHKLYDLATSLIATAPQLLGYLDADGSVLPLDVAKPNVGGGYQAIFHLYHAGQLPVTDEPARLWVIKQLRRIDSQTGIRKAGFLADLLVQEGRLKH